MDIIDNSLSNIPLTFSQDNSEQPVPGSSPACPIIIPPPVSPLPVSNWEQAQTSNYLSLPSEESFAWPSLWFEVPSLSPQLVPSSGSAPPDTTNSMYPLPLESLPDLIHSKTPDTDASPLSLHETCTTPSPSPSHMSSPNVVSICDVPLVAPRPLPFTPPLFLQFDSLPEQDEDLSFPPYTRSRRIPTDSSEKQKPKRSAAALLTNTGANSGADATMTDVGTLGPCYDAIENESQYQYRDASVPKRRKISAANSGDLLLAAPGGIENIRPCIQALPSMNTNTTCNTNGAFSTHQGRGQARSRSRTHMSMRMRNVRKTTHSGSLNGKLINEHVDPYQLHMNEISRNQYWDNMGVLPLGGGRLNVWHDNHGASMTSGCDAMSVRNGWNEVIGAGVVGVGPASVGWV